MVITACSTRTVYDSPPATPLTVFPAEAQQISRGQMVRFVWRMTADTQSYDFHLFDRTSGDITRYAQSSLSPQRICREGACSIEVVVNLPVDKGHAWRVRATNSAGSSAWSRTVFAVR